MMENKMTTELFHAQLEENIVRAADERKRHQAELQVISRNYESSLDSIERMEDEAGESYRCARNAFEKAKMNIRKNSVIVESFAMRLDFAEIRRRLRRLIFGHSTTIPSRATAITSLRDTEKRGVLSGAEAELLHPGWTKDKKGGVSDEEK